MPQTKTESMGDCLTRDQLPPDVLVRLDHAGKWVAWDYGLTRAVASGADEKAVRDEAIRAGVARPVMEWIPPIAGRAADVG